MEGLETARNVGDGREQSCQNGMWDTRDSSREHIVFQGRYYEPFLCACLLDCVYILLILQMLKKIKLASSGRGK